MEYKLKYSNYRYRFQNDWAPYAFPEEGSHLVGDYDIQHRFSENGAGVPLLKAGEQVWAIDDTEHTLIVGESGSKKTRCAIMPLIYRLAQKGESMVISDVKGELSSNPKLSALLQVKGYEVVTLDFRSCSADGYNLLEEPFRRYCLGKKDKAMAQVCNHIHALVHRNGGTRVDPFWDDSSETYLNTVTNLLFEICSQKPEEYKKYVNMATICKFSTYQSAVFLEEILGEIIDELEGQENNTVLMLKNVLGSPERTLSSVMSTLGTHIKDFLVQERLLRMLSTSTFESDLYEKKMAIFLIVPDEVKTYDSIAGMVIDSIYCRSIEQFGERYQNTGTPAPRRVNFILDEFCNLHISDMDTKISACRSRHIRFYLVVQSMAQLSSIYPDSAATIRGNCKSLLFMQSSDPDTLGFVQSLCGVTYITEAKGGEALITVEELKKLKKTWDYKEAVFVRDETVYVATLWDIDHFPEVEGAIPERVSREFPQPAVYTPRQLELDYLCHGVIACPFKEGAKPKGRRNTVSKKNYTDALDGAFNELFGETDSNE